MKRIFVAGPYSADNVIDVLDNIRKGQRACTELLLAGYAPFCPWNDYHFQLMLRDEESLTVEDYYQYTLAWLPVSDAMLVLPDHERSDGTSKEIQKAKELEIPIYYDVDVLKERCDPNGEDS